MPLTELKAKREKIEDRIREQAAYGVLDYDLAVELGSVSFQIRQIENPNWLREAA